MWSGPRIVPKFKTFMLGVSNQPSGGRLSCRSIRRVLLVSLCQLWLIQPKLAVSQQLPQEHVSLELISEQDALVPSRDLWVGIRFSLQDGWHTYWVNPGDSGEPARIEW